MQLIRKTVPLIQTENCKNSFEMLKQALFSRPIVVYPDPNHYCTLLRDGLKCAWSAVLTQAHTTVIGGKSVIHQHPVTYVNGLFQDSQLNWAVLTKEAYTVYKTVKELSFYLVNVDIICIVIIHL